jgi:hypothetical protein
MTLLSHHRAASINPTLLNSSRLQLKMFIHPDPASLEKEIQEWLRVCPVHIEHVTQSQSEKGGAFMLVVSLFYRAD